MRQRWAAKSLSTNRSKININRAQAALGRPFCVPLIVAAGVICLAAGPPRTAHAGV